MSVQLQAISAVTKTDATPTYLLAPVFGALLILIYAAVATGAGLIATVRRDII
jgi:hypothetical protein